MVAYRDSLRTAGYGNVLEITAIGRGAEIDAPGAVTQGGLVPVTGEVLLEHRPGGSVVIPDGSLRE